MVFVTYALRSISRGTVSLPLPQLRRFAFLSGLLQRCDSRDGCELLVKLRPISVVACFCSRPHRRRPPRCGAAFARFFASSLIRRFRRADSRIDCQCFVEEVHEEDVVARCPDSSQRSARVPGGAYVGVVDRLATEAHDGVADLRTRLIFSNERRRGVKCSPTPVRGQFALVLGQQRNRSTGGAWNAQVEARLYLVDVDGVVASMFAAL